MIYLFCGIAIGVVMGLTGAGGALVAIPLFMQFLGMNLKEASVYSLVAVVVASLLNYVGQRGFTQYRTAFYIVSTSAIGSYFAAPYKERLPTLYVVLILTVVSLYALWSVWNTDQINVAEKIKPHESPILSICLGGGLGIITTFTGIGGGVLMLPLFLALYGHSESQAVATSLFAVGLSSLASLMAQVIRGATFEVDLHLLLLLTGILAAVLLLKSFVRQLHPSMVGRVRRLVFTVVVLVSISKVLIE